jgi:hypothetical protein
VKETLRLAPATPVGLARVVPPEGAAISGVRIPGGVGVSPSQRRVKVDLKAKAPSLCICRRMYSCVPMTSCQSVGSGPRLPNWTSSWLLSQSDHEVVKESSECIVSLLCLPKASDSYFFDSLAYCELYLGLAHLFRRFNLRIDESRCELSRDPWSLRLTRAYPKTAQSRLEGTFFILLHWRASARLLLSKVFLTTVHAIFFYFRP